MLLRTLFGSHANLPPNCRDGSWESNIRMLTGTIKVDWIQLPVEQYLAALPTLKQGVIAGVFRQKGAAPWGITRAEKLQLSVLLPTDLSLEDWYAGVYGLPTVWPEASMLGADNLRKVAGYDFHLLRKKYDVRSMWGDLDPQWRLLQSQLETRGPGCDSSQISPSGRVMTRKRLCVLMEILQHGRLGMLLTTLFGSHANLPHHWCFQAKRRFFVPCMPKLERKNKSSPLHILALRWCMTRL